MSFEPDMSDAATHDPVLALRGLGKCYHIYEKPEHRLLQGLLRGRKKFHRDFWALRNVTMDVHRGETVGVIGRNGSGKSTLLQLVCGTLTPTEGSVESKGRIAALLELGSGFNPEFTGRENVFLNASLLGLHRVQIEERFPAIAEFADIGQFIDQPVKTYSSGMFVRLAFAVIANTDADVLIIDEALAVGDALFTQKCMRFLHQFRSRGTILFVSHDTGAVLNLCDKALWLQEGQVTTFGRAKDVVEGYVQWNMEQLQGSSASALARASPTQPGAADSEREVVASDAAAGVPPSLGDPRSGETPAPTEAHLPPQKDFGKGGATIEYVGLHRSDGRRAHTVKGGEAVTLRIAARATTDVLSPILGFHVKDRLGQVVFGENSFVSTAGSALALARNELIVASFDFVMPHMRTGEYVFDVAFAEGTQAIHVQHHWVFDALVVHVLSERPVFGILSIPYSVAIRKALGELDRPDLPDAFAETGTNASPAHVVGGR